MSSTSCHAPCVSTPPASKAGGWLVALALLAVRAYQLAISPLLGPHCRFSPSCSAYMGEAIRRHGLSAGVWRGLCRLARCHPWHAGGFDPVD